MYWRTLKSLAPSTHWEFSVSILKFNVKMAPKISGFFNTLPLDHLLSDSSTFRIPRLLSFDGNELGDKVMLVTRRCWQFMDLVNKISLFYNRINWFRNINRKPYQVRNTSITLGNLKTSFGKITIGMEISMITWKLHYELGNSRVLSETKPFSDNCVSNYF